MKNNIFGAVRRFHLIPKLFCVLFAFIFWVYVMEVDSPDYTETFEDIPVTVVGASTIADEKNLSVFSDGDTFVDVTVKGQKRVIAKYSKEDIIVKVDVSDVTKSGHYTLDIHCDLPSGISFVESSVETVELSIDKKAKESFTLVDDGITGYRLGSSKYSLGDITFDVETVTVTGPESRIKEISKAVVERDLGQITLTESIETDGVIVLKDQYGEPVKSRYLELTTEKVIINIPVHVKEYKPLKCDTVHGLFSTKNCDIKIEPAGVMIQGDPAIVERIEYISLSDIDEKTFKQDDTVTEYINIPDNVSLVPGEPTHATVTVDLASSFKTDYVVVDQFTLINTDGKNYKVLNEPLRITIVGEKSAVNVVKDNLDLINVTVDLENYNDVPGPVKVPCTITFDVDPGWGIVYEYGVYEVRLEAE